jgi:hypothetical protein
VLFPYVMKDAKRQGRSWWQNISINYASIQFKAGGVDPGDGRGVRRHRLRDHLADRVRDEFNLASRFPT